MRMSIREAINLTLDEEMARDERVVILGADVASDQGGFMASPPGYQKSTVSSVLSTRPSLSRQ